MGIKTIVSNLQEFADYHKVVTTPIIIYVKSGIASVNVNLESISLKVDSILWTTQSSILHLEWASADFSAELITTDADTYNSCNSSESATCAHWHATIGNEALASIFKNTISNLHHAALLQMEGENFAARCVESLYIALHHIEGMLQANEETKLNSAANRTYHQFIGLINEHIATEHEVRFYAQELNITPKYLNDLMQRRLQTAAKDMISKILASLIRHELCHSDVSAKQLASKYNFSDQSSMGKFFKKETGMSPQNFRDSLS